MTNFALAITTVVAMAFAMIFLERVLQLHPCPLCMTQRVFMVAAGLIALIAAIHNPRLTGRRIYAALCLLMSIGGGAVAARHIWLQSLPEHLVPACGPSLEYMLETLPFSETISLILMGDGNCADVVWTFMGLSIPQQVLLLFVAMSAVALWQLVRKD